MLPPCSLKSPSYRLAVDRPRWPQRTTAGKVFFRADGGRSRQGRLRRRGAAGQFSLHAEVFPCLFPSSLITFQKGRRGAAH
jgi:hypothetical protein